MNRKMFYVLGIVALLLLVTFTTAIIRSSAKDRKIETKPTAVKPRPDLPRVISLRLTRNGFEPAQLTVPAGDYMIAIHNRTERKSLDLRLDREAGARLHQVKMDLEKINWHGKAKLTPGRYVFTAAEDFRWVCEITVTTP